MAQKQIKLLVTSAFAVSGTIVTKGEEIALPESEAKNLLQRGKVELAEATAEGDENWLDSHSVAELRELAKEYDIEGADKMKKAQLVEAIEAAEAD